jgi:hypothetical protein
LRIIGPAVACAWLWLLPLVVGWLHTSPNCNEAKIRTELTSLNGTVYISAAVNGDPALLASGSTDERAIEIGPPHRQEGGEYSLLARESASELTGCSVRHGRRVPMPPVLQLRTAVPLVSFGGTDRAGI